MSSLGIEDRLAALKSLKDSGLIEAGAYDSAVRSLLQSVGLGGPGGDGASFGASSDSAEGSVKTDEVEILIHNLSHSDMMMSLGHESFDKQVGGKGGGEVGAVIARPKFSNYRAISEKIWSYVCEHLPDEEVVMLNENLYRRSPVATMEGNYPLEPLPIPEMVPLGFQLAGARDASLNIDDLSTCHVRSGDSSRLPPKSSKSPCFVNAVYFPLLSVLIPKWLTSLDGQGKGDSRKVVIIISGRGTPNNPTGNVLDNSTKATGKLAQVFFEQAYPNVQVVVLHSVTNLFRYDENIVFVRRELVPLIDQTRNDLALKLAEKWKDAMGITLSFADGSSARVSAINQSLRHYRPSYMHFWQLKTFWCENKLCFDDVESHSFEEISTEPAISVDQTSAPVMMIVAAMQQFRSEFERIINGGTDYETDLAKFWLRKTKKPVLAILLVQKPGSAPRIYRGTNMEVSMPTGSLCAERNVIGSALADDITLRRQDLKMIAVYSAKTLVKAAADSPPPAAAAAAAAAATTTTATTVANPSTVSAGDLSSLSVLHASQASSNDGSAPNSRRNSSVGSVDMNGGGNGSSSSSSSSSSSASSSINNTALSREGSLENGLTIETSAGAAEGSMSAPGSSMSSPRGSNGLPRSPAAAAAAAGQKRKILNMPQMGAASGSSAALRAKGLVATGSPKRMRHKARENSQGSIGSYHGGGNGGGHSSPDSGDESVHQQAAAATRPPVLPPQQQRRSLGGVASGSKANTRQIQHSFMSPSYGGPSVDDLTALGAGVEGGLVASASSTSLSNLHHANSGAGVGGGSNSAGNAAAGWGRLDSSEVNEGFEMCAPCNINPGGSGMTGVMGGDYDSQQPVPWTTRNRVITVQEDDMNPLAPCGACKEWLKKIAVVNPQFAVITFTDYECNGVYQEHLEHEK